MTKRKTAVDYRKEYKETAKTMKSITAYVRKRVVEMAELYPDVVVVGPIIVSVTSFKYLCWLKVGSIDS